MFALNCFVVVLLGAAVAAQDNQHHNANDHLHGNQRYVDEKVNVDVYYESLCPDSAKFFTSQLYVVLQGNLSDYINLTLIPYGKTTYKIEYGDTHNFSCHHGPQECVGNRIHACALLYINDTAGITDHGYNKVALAFLNCLMKETVNKGAATEFPTKQCATDAADYHVRNVHKIENCAHHLMGTTELLKYAKLTESLGVKDLPVPTIVFNKHYNKADSDLAQSNFVKALCKYITGEKPYECNGASGMMSITNILLGILLSFVISSLK